MLPAKNNPPASASTAMTISKTFKILFMGLISFMLYSIEAGDEDAVKED
jgi:hypothetical protein